MRLILLFALPILSLFFQACESPLASVNKSFDDGCWPIQDTLEVEFDNKDTSQVYSLWFPLEVEAEDYPYNNIHLRAAIQAPSGSTTVIPARFGLMDPTGEWLSEDVGERVGFQLLLSSGLRFNQSGTYSIALYHFMQDSSLCGITSAGITLEKAEPQAQ
jgi:gliding motility-associated lipoprotein GldH